MTVGARIARFLFGDDVFISYARADGATYASRLAAELADRNFWCRFDQWGSKPSPDVPPELLRALSRSSLLVVISTVTARVSGPVETEVREFLRTGRTIIPIDLDGEIRAAKWWPLLDGLAVSKAEPFGDVVERVEKAATFARRNVRLLRVAMAIVVLVGVFAGLAVVAGIWANREATRAEQELRRAEQAEGYRKSAEAARDAARSERQAADADARGARADKERADLDREKANGERLAAQGRAEAQRRLTDAANQTREIAERRRDEVIASLRSKQAEVDSQELARLVYGPDGSVIDHKLVIENAMRALQLAETDAAKDALIGSVRQVMSAKGVQPVAVDGTGRFAAVAGRNGSGNLIALGTNDATVLCGGPDPIHSLSFAPDGRWLLVVRRAKQSLTAASDVSSFDLWSTTAGERVSTFSSRMDTESAAIRWAPDSSMFFAADSLQRRGIRVSVGASGRMTSYPQELRLPFVKFNDDQKLFATHGDVVSLWDYSGKLIWSKPVGALSEVWFEKKPLQLIIESGGFEEESLKYVVVDLESSGRPVKESTRSPDEFAAASPYWHQTRHQLRLLGKALRQQHPRELAQGCEQIDIDPEAAVGYCFRRKLEPLVFNIRSLEVVGTLRPWTFDEIRSPLLFDAARSRFALTAGRQRGPAGGSFIVAWDAARRAPLWESPVAPTLFAFPFEQPVAFSEDGSRLLTAQITGSDDYLDWTMLSVSTGAKIGTLKLKLRGGWPRLNKNGSEVVTAPEAGQLDFWDVDTQKVKRTISMKASDDEKDLSDDAALSAGAPAQQLIEIAKRRLRACEAR